MTVIWTLPKARELKRQRQFLARGTRHLLDQRRRVKRLCDAGLDVRQAKRILELFEDSQLAMSAQLTRRERER